MIRRILSKIFFTLKLHLLWLWINRKSIPVLMVHGVIDDRDLLAWRPLRSYLPQEEFERYIKFLSRHFNFISIEQAKNIINGSAPGVKNAMVISFDDGYFNNINYALPILKKYGIPAVFFPTVKHLSNKTPYWFDRLDYAVQKNIRTITPVRVEGLEVIVNPENCQTLAKSISKLVKAILYAYKDDTKNSGAIEKILVEIESIENKSLLDDYESDKCCRVMTLEELVEVSSEPLITIGSHTLDHVRLTAIAEDQAHLQLQSSRLFIEQHTDQICDVLCYPNGDYSQKLLAIVKSCGYSLALTSDEGTNKPGVNPLQLNRFNLPKNKSEAELICIMSGLFDTYERIRNIFKKENKSQW